MNLPACTYKYKNHAQSQLSFAPSNNGETVTIRNSGHKACIHLYIFFLAISTQTNCLLNYDLFSCVLEAQYSIFCLSILNSVYFFQLVVGVSVTSRRPPVFLMYCIYCILPNVPPGLYCLCMGVVQCMAGQYLVLYSIRLLLNEQYHHVMHTAALNCTEFLQSASKQKIDEEGEEKIKNYLRCELFIFSHACPLSNWDKMIQILCIMLSRN